MAYRAKKWLVLENLAVAAAARALSKRDLTYQILPVGMYGSRPVEELNRPAAVHPNW